MCPNRKNCPNWQKNSKAENVKTEETSKSGNGKKPPNLNVSKFKKWKKNLRLIKTCQNLIVSEF